MRVLINLDSAIERRQAMARQLDTLGLPFDRVGVDLRSVRAAEVDVQVRTRFPGLQFDRRRLSNAEIGCWLSHLTAWQLLLHSEFGFCTVIEDDLALLPGFDAAVTNLADRDRFDVVYLGTSSRNVSQRRCAVVNGLFVHEPVGVIYNTWGYSIARGWVEKFFGAMGRRISLPIDHFLGGRGGRLQPHIGVLQPPVVIEDPVLGAASQIGPYTQRIDRLPLVQDVRRRILASPVSAFYYALYRYL